MKHLYYKMLALIIGVMMIPALGFAQDGFTDCPDDQDECLVQFQDSETNEIIVNALRNTIANDTLSDGSRLATRVYKLIRGGFYHNSDRIQNGGNRHIRIIGQTVEEAQAQNPNLSLVCGDGDDDCGPAIIQRVHYEDGGDPDGVMIYSGGTNADLTLKNLWLMGQDDQGTKTAYQQIQLDASNSRYVFDNVIFDRNDWHFLGWSSRSVDVIVRNSHFRNIFGPTQQWEGLGFRTTAGADSVIFENNTFLNIGFTPFQSEAAPINYFLVNHNTFVNVGRQFSAGTQWKEIYVTNNVFINPFWHGEGSADYNEAGRENYYTGFFGIDDLPATEGSNESRRIVVSNNSYWRDQAIVDYYADTVRAQPLINDTTAKFFSDYPDNMVLTDAVEIPSSATPSPNIATYTDNASEMIASIDALRNGMEAPRYYWDPNRAQSPLLPNWPLPEDFSYEDDLTGTDDLPLGDLNYFPADKETYLANRDDEVASIEELAGERIVIENLATMEAENAVSLGGDAEIVNYEGFVEYRIDGSGFLEWEFTLEEATTINELRFWVRSQDAVRGANIFVNGQQINNDAGGETFGDFRFYNLAQDTYPEGGIIVQTDTLQQSVQDILTLEAGTHTVRWEPGWGYYSTAGLELYSGGQMVADLSGDQVSDFGGGVMPSAGEDAEGWVPSLLRSVSLGNSGSMTVLFDSLRIGDTPQLFPAGMYYMRIFYENSGEASEPFITVDGEEVNTFGNFVQTPNETSDVTSYHFEVGAATDSIEVVISGSNARVDYIILNSQTGGTFTDLEKDQLPDGFSLSQNYPNPFNPTTKINYSIPQATNVQLTVFNILGQKVATLIDGRQFAGSHTVNFDARNLASGVYFYRLKAGKVVQQRKMTLIK